MIVSDSPAKPIRPHLISNDKDPLSGKTDQHKVCKVTIGLTPVVCKDTPGFKDEFGDTCAGWRGYDCWKAPTYGYTNQGLEDLIRNCPVACKALCEPSLKGSFLEVSSEPSTRGREPMTAVSQSNRALLPPSEMPHEDASSNTSIPQLEMAEIDPSKGAEQRHSLEEASSIDASTFATLAAAGGCTYQIYGTAKGFMFQKMWVGRNDRADITNLKCGTVYQFKARQACTGSSYWSDFGDPLDVITLQTVPSRLNYPYKAPNSIITATEMTVQWDPASSDGGAEVTEYVLMQSTKKDYVSSRKFGFDDSFKEIYTGKQNRFNIKQLTPNTIYHYSVIARNANGDSIPSDVQSLSTKKIPLPQQEKLEKMLNLAH